MHILSTADTVGGVWTYALDLARALPQHQFSLVTMGRCPSGAQRAEAEAISNLRLYPTEWKLEWMADPWADVDRAGEWLLQLHQQLQPGLVHLNGYAHAALPFACPTLVVAHSCVGSWWRAVKGAELPVEWDEYRKRVRQGLHAATVVVSPTRALLDEVQSIYGDMGRTCVIPNGVGPGPHLEGRRQPYILAAGRLWDEAKNIGILEKVAGEVSWPIRIAGEEAFEGNAFESGGLETLGLLTPAVMKHTMAEAEIWAHPALYEPFGLAVLEAAQAGCALVLSDIPTLRELWDEAAVFVAPQDASAWKITLEDLIRQPARRNALGIKARGRAKQYSLDRCAQAYDSLYRSLT